MPARARTNNCFLLSLHFLVVYLAGTLSFDLGTMLSSHSQSISGKLPLPDLKSLVSPETLQRVLQAKALGIPVVSAEVSLPDSAALDQLIAKLKPKGGRFDPALLEKLRPSLESINPNRQGPLDHVFQRFANSNEEKAVLTTTFASPTSDITTRKRGKSKKNKYSAKFRMNETMIVENPNLANLSAHDNPRATFSYITDPNIRNHRLYDWEFETYKNFTHIDQAEDLLADESGPGHSSHENTKTAITKAGHSSKSTSKPSTTSTGWVPHFPKERIPPRALRPPYNPKEPLPASYEDLYEPTTSHSNMHVQTVPAPGVFVRFSPDQSDSMEPNTKKHKRLRAPLRVSSMENQLFRLTSEPGKYYDENSSRPSAENFRPSQPELSAPVFVDPDQDFFTSTIRHPKGSDKSSERPTYDMPVFPASKNIRKKDRVERPPSRHRDRNNHYKDEKYNRNKFFSDEFEENYSVPSKYKTDRILMDSSDSSQVDRDRDHRYMQQHSMKKQNYDKNYMSEYLGHTPSSASSDHSPYYDRPESHGDNSHNHNEAQQQQQQQAAEGGLRDYFGQLVSTQEDQQRPPLLSDQIYAGGQHQQYYHPYGSYSDQIHYIEEEGSSSWFNTFFILGGLVALSALIAFFLPSLLHVNAVGKDVDKVGEPSTDVDLWQEIKGVYSDLVHIVRGDYAYFNNKRHGNSLVNLTYRNEDYDDSTASPLLGDTVEISRASRRSDTSRIDLDSDTLAFHYNSSSVISSTPSPFLPNSSSADSFLGEWAKVQLINN